MKKQVSTDTILRKTFEPIVNEKNKQLKTRDQFKQHETN